jgi:hypothetical protein
MTCLSLAILLNGCAQPPTDRLQQAQQLVDAAKAAGAPEYAMEEWTNVEVAFERAKDELANQEKVFAVFRSYTKADEMLKRVAGDAIRVAATVIQKKAEAKTAAETNERDARTVLASAQELLSQAPIGKDRAGMKKIGEKLSGLRDSLDSIHRLTEAGDYGTAAAQAQALKEEAAVVAGDLRKAIEKHKSRKASARISARAHALS